MKVQLVQLAEQSVCLSYIQIPTSSFFSANLFTTQLPLTLQMSRDLMLEQLNKINCLLSVDQSVPYIRWTIEHAPSSWITMQWAASMLNNYAIIETYETN